MENRCSFRFFLEGVAVHVNILRNKKEEYFVSKNFVWCVIWQLPMKFDFLQWKFFKISILNNFFNQVDRVPQESDNQSNDRTWFIPVDLKSTASTSLKTLL